MATTPERSKPCPCGSGLKYKRCCGLKRGPAEWPAVAEALAFPHPRADAIRRTFFAVSDHLRKQPNPGACHLLSGVFYVLLSEQGIDSVLRIGEVLRPDGKFFDHSWIEINQLPFDVAIQLTYSGERNPPVYAGVNLATGRVTNLQYGARSPFGLDDVTREVYSTPFVSYMDGFPLGRWGAWEIVAELASDLGLDVSIATMRTEYVTTDRVL